MPRLDKKNRFWQKPEVWNIFYLQKMIKTKVINNKKIYN